MRLIPKRAKNVTAGRLATFMVWALLYHVADAAPTPAPAAEWWSSLRDLDGASVNPFADNNNSSQAFVFVFVTADCPISNRYAPEIERLHKRYRSKGIRFHLVYPDPALPVQSLRRHSSEFNLTLPALRDPQHALVARAKARVTPEVAVFDRHTQLLYHGRIDNRYADFGKSRRRVTNHDLVEVIEAIRAGHTITNSAAPAVGCPIAPLP